MKYIIFSALALLPLLTGCDGGRFSGNMEGTQTEVIVRQRNFKGQANSRENNADQSSGQSLNTRDLVDAAGNTLDAINGASASPSSSVAPVDVATESEPALESAPKKETGKKTVDSEPSDEESDAPIIPQKMNVVKPGSESGVQKQVAY